MPRKSSLIINLEEETPASWSKFEKWLFKLIKSRNRNMTDKDRNDIIKFFCSAYFEDQLGYFLRYLEENNINWLAEHDASRMPDGDERWKQTIINSFKELEQ